MESNSNNKAMSREEELQQAAEEWADYYKHAEDLCDYISVRVAFREGAKWAEEHPKNVWHSADEEPDNLAQIVCVCNIFGSKQVCNFRVDKGNLIEWQRIVEIRHIEQWAYFDELIED